MFDNSFQCRKYIQVQVVVQQTVSRFRVRGVLAELSGKARCMSAHMHHLPTNKLRTAFHVSSMWSGSYVLR